MSEPQVFDLDALEREGKPDVFVTRIGGRDYELVDPKEQDYRELIAVQEAAFAGNPQAAVDMLVKPEDREEFFRNPLPSWKLEALVRRYNEHFGLPVPGEAGASPRS